MDLPVIATPIFPRWIWMEEVTYSHIPIATIITAFLVLAPILEYIGYHRNDPRYDRLAKSFVFFCLIIYSPGAALGTGIPMFIIGLWPEFWSRWANLFFWPLFYQFVFFLLDVAFLFFGYYLMWDRLQNRKRLHIFFGVMTAVFGLLIQAVWDSLGAYMTTPSTALPMINEPVGWSAAAFFNPSYPYLFFHRFFGNISYVMLATGGIFALKYWRQKDENERAYFGWASDLTFTIGFLAFFAMPFIGWGMARVYQEHAPNAFHAIMGGHVSGAFTVKMGLILGMLILGGGYLFSRHRQKFLLGAMTVGTLSLFYLFWIHPPIDWFSNDPTIWRIAFSIGLACLIGYFWLMRRVGRWDTRWWKRAMFAAGMMSFFIFALGGFTRERARQPYTVYNQLIKPEVTDLEADRFLMYETCIGCHFNAPNDLKRFAGADWPKIVQEQRKQFNLDLTDDEADRLARFLEEQY